MIHHARELSETWDEVTLHQSIISVLCPCPGRPVEDFSAALPHLSFPVLHPGRTVPRAAGIRHSPTLGREGRGEERGRGGQAFIWNTACCRCYEHGGDNYHCLSVLWYLASRQQLAFRVTNTQAWLCILSNTDAAVDYTGFQWLLSTLAPCDYWCNRLYHRLALITKWGAVIIASETRLYRDSSYQMRVYSWQ